MDSTVRQRQLIIDRLCHDTGGPCAYTGRPLTTVHENLKITAQWEVFMKILDSMRRFGLRVQQLHGQ